MRLSTIIPPYYRLRLDKKSYTPGLWVQYDLFLLVAFFTELLTPYFIWKGYLPASLRWVGDVATILVIVLAVLRMLVFNRIPKAAVLILGLSTLGIASAVLQGQGLSATLWGWMRMFKYPMMGLYAYQHPYWPEKLAGQLWRFCMWLLAANLLFQLWQYLNGQTPGDDLAGTFGRRGVGPLIFFLAFVICLALGNWLVTGNWRVLLFALGCGMAASALSEIKAFPAVLVLLGLGTLSVHMIRGGQVRRLIIYVVSFVVISYAFISLYNIVIAEGRGKRRFEEYLNLETTLEYLDTDGGRGGGRYRLGRNFALRYGWNIIQQDGVTFLFGTGLGSRSSSVSLGIAGQGLLQGYYGLTSGTSLLVMMQEMGMTGLAAFAGVVLWLVGRLWREAMRAQHTDLAILLYGTLLFTLFWPFWLWYHRVWDFAVPMILYWCVLGFVLNQVQRVEPAGEEVA
ncbi:MAG: hypothetical protein D6706_02670 [Chloroflexi bacterium]|nr:MAG: hypothetical protein D6706_02670 [Chloroflexota bacterium]